MVKVAKATRAAARVACPLLLPPAVWAGALEWAMAVQVAQAAPCQNARPDKLNAMARAPLRRSIRTIVVHVATNA